MTLDEHDAMPAVKPFRMVEDEEEDKRRRRPTVSGQDIAHELSRAEQIASLMPAERKAFWDKLTEAEATELMQSWEFWGRPKQFPPPDDDDWFIWFLRSGRGFGKTRAGAEWINRRAMQGNSQRWIALISQTPADARDDMLHGPGGILNNARPNEKPEFNPSARRVTWPSGATATIYSGAHPEQVRGFSGDTAWCDELAAWQYPTQTWTNLLLGLREANVSQPRVCVTTTPKPIEIIRLLTKRALEGSGVVMITGSSWENRANLASSYYDEVIKPLEATTLGRQEISGELIEEHPDALWALKQIEADRADKPPYFARVAIAVDPAEKDTEESSETGITVGGVTTAEHGYLLADLSQRSKPKEWGQTVVDAYYEFKADHVVVETNAGGDMIAHVIHTIDGNIPIKEVHASRGKQTRAQPVATKSSMHFIHHCGSFGPLEDQLVGWVPGQKSPDRLDSYVWLWTDLMHIGQSEIPKVVPVSMEQESPWLIS